MALEGWEHSLAGSVTAPEELAERFGIDPEPLRKVVARYPLRITPYYLGLVREVGDPIWRQCIPDPLELDDAGLAPDPLAEGELSPVPGLIHRYPDRVVWLVSNACAVYCRFCMRKRQVGCGEARVCARTDDALHYLAEHREIRDVILSGGDPLMLSDERLADLLSRIRSIPHVEIIRIGTRVPATLPERITERFCRMLQRFHPVYLNLHFNHPIELTDQAAAACGRLADAGVPLGNQTVLLNGVNDDPATMTRLMQRLLACRVRPYYLHHPDLVAGTAHFRPSVRTGISLMERLRGHTSGLATPYYVIDLPGGKGKVPVLPEYGRWEGDTLHLRTYQGETVSYQDNVLGDC